MHDLHNTNKSLILTSGIQFPANRVVNPRKILPISRLGRTIIFLSGPDKLMNQIRSRPEPRLLSLVIPCFNESEALGSLREALDKFAGELKCGMEVILIDDGSSDNTWEIISNWNPSGYTLKALSLSRNFGHQQAVTAGLDRTTGDAIVILDADLQDPPHVIHQMVRAYTEGFDVVHGKRINRDGESHFKKLSAWLFYRLMKIAGASHLALDSGDFRLVSRACLDEVLQMREQRRFLRGLFSWAGFNQTSISYKRPPRTEGHTKYSLGKMLMLAWTAMVSFSLLPLRLVSIAGTVTAFGGLLYAIYAVARWAFYGDTVKGWATLVILITGIGGMMLISMGILGEYIARIYEELRNRPLYIIQDEINNDLNQPAPRQGNRLSRQLGSIH